MKKVKIQSFSDVITNSSSELFVIRSTDEAWAEIQNKIDAIAKAIEIDGGDNWEYVDRASEETAQKYRDYGYGIDMEAGDHYIYVYENCMPWPLMEMIDDYLPYNKKLQQLNNGENIYVERYHLG